jgi:hypothetical protein
MSRARLFALTLAVTFRHRGREQFFRATGSGRRAVLRKTRSVTKRANCHLVRLNHGVSGHARTQTAGASPCY